MINYILPYLRKEISTLVTLSTVIALLLSSPLLLSNFLLLQPVQAQTELTFQTPKPATGTDPSGHSISLTFYAQGTPSTSNPSQVDITKGTFNYEVVQYGNFTGEITSVSFTNNTSGGYISFKTDVGVAPFTVTSNCSTSDSNVIRFTGGYSLEGPVECTSSQGGGGNTTSSSMTGTTTTTQDSDGDGIPDSSDRCANNSNPRCFKEGDTTTQHQQSSSPSLPGNQTR